MTPMQTWLIAAPVFAVTVWGIVRAFNWSAERFHDWQIAETQRWVEEEMEAQRREQGVRERLTAAVQISDWRRPKDAA